jgi:hypothetical protein
VFNNLLHSQWGPHGVDLFADRTSNLLEKYVSWKRDSGAWRIDAFTIPWNNLGNPYTNPHWNLILRYLEKIQREEALVITVVVPYWHRQPGSLCCYIWRFILLFSCPTPTYKPSLHWHHGHSSLSGSSPFGGSRGFIFNTGTNSHVYFFATSTTPDEYYHQ